MDKQSAQREKSKYNKRQQGHHVQQSEIMQCNCSAKVMQNTWLHATPLAPYMYQGITGSVDKVSTNFETALAGSPYRNYSVYMMHCWCYIRALNPSQTVAIYPTEVETISGKCRLTTPKCFAQHGNRNTTLKTQNRAYESTHICTMGPSRSAKLDLTKRKETEKCERGLDGRLCRRRDKCSRTRPFLGATGF